MVFRQRNDSLRFRTTWSCEVGILTANCLTLLLPLVIIQLFDRVIPNKATETLAVLGLILVGALVLEAVLRGAVGQMMAVAGETYEVAAQDRLIDQILNEDESYGHGSRQVIYLEALDTIERVRSMHAGNTRNSLFDVPFSMLFLFAFWYVAPSLFAAMVVILVAALAGNALARRRALTFTNDLRDKRNRTTALSAEILGGIEHLKGMRAELFMLRRIESLFAKTAVSTEKLVLTKAVGRVINEVVAQGTPLVIGVFGALAVIEGTLTAGALAAAILLSGRIIQPFLRYQQAADQDYLMAPFLNALDDITSRAPAPTKTTSDTRLEKIELREIGFCDDREQPILTNVNLTVSSGEIVAISGDSGVGKSLLLNIIAGAVRPSSGQILYNEKDLAAAYLKHVRYDIGMMRQNFRTPSGSALDLITGFGGRSRLPDALPIVEELGLARFFAAHPKGLHVNVGGSFASSVPTAVQARVALVPTFLRNPSLLLFDEANAALDLESDHLLLEALKRRRGQMSMVLVTQRPSYAAIADRTYRLEGGSLVPVPASSSQNQSNASLSA